MKNTIIAAISIVASLSFSATAFAEMVGGEVKKVDASAQKITIKHGPIKDLDMGAMTMVFKAADPKMTSTFKPGDKVKFEAARVNGQLSVTKIEKAK